MAGMTASVAGRYAASKIQHTLADAEDKEFIRNMHYTKMAEGIAGTLGELKGAVMKVGQIASQTQDLLPKEFSQALRSLQNDAPPVSYSVIADQIIAEFGSSPEELFARFDQEPFAAASIGQVHRALTHEGQEVVVKVQYPGVAESMDSDLAQLKLALRLGGLIRLPKQSVDALFSELKARLREELDYRKEAENLVIFRQFHTRHQGIIVPEVIAKYCSDKVLTMEYLAGVHIDEVAKQYWPKSVVDGIARNLFTLITEQIFVFQKIHGDPHPGNFAFLEDGSVIVYDYGCIKTLKPEIVKAYADLIRASLSEDYDAVDDALIRLGAREPSLSSPGEAYYKPWRDVFYQAFEEGQAFDFGSSKLHLELTRLMPELFRHMRYFKPPVESMYIDRVLGGQYWMMKSLGVKYELRPLLDQALSKLN